MARMEGGELIAEFLIREKILYLFGICGHGNVDKPLVAAPVGED